MSAVVTQPPPLGRLEREKHISMIIRTFQNRCDPSHAGNPTEQRSENLSTWDQVPKTDPVARDTWSFLDPVSHMYITAEPELQGPRCVPRRVFNIAAGPSRAPILVVVEESSCVCLQCCGPARACSLTGFDPQGQQRFYFERPFRVDACCFGCCLMEVRAFTPQKELIGTVRQRWSMFTPLLEVGDPRTPSSTVTIQGPCCPCRCLTNQTFQIVSSVSERIGTIWKKWPGFNAERNMDHDYFGLQVPPGMDSQSKVLLLAATFLLNHMFFEMS
ncbi:phospholipid scramblase 2 [Neosynchiropus ocellatus]